MSSSVGGSETTLADSGTVASTLAYDIPPSIAANSSPQRNNHDAAFASRAKASGSAMSPRLNSRSVGPSKSAIDRTIPPLAYCRLAASGARPRHVEHPARGQAEKQASTLAG